MAEMTLEQQRAVAMASARLRLQQKTSMPEPEFEREARQIAAGSTPGGIAAETGKGLLRGASNVAGMVQKGATTDLLGPIVAPFVSRKVEELAAPSRELVRPAPI